MVGSFFEKEQGNTFLHYDEIQHATICNTAYYCIKKRRQKLNPLTTLKKVIFNTDAFIIARICTSNDLILALKALNQSSLVILLSLLPHYDTCANHPSTCSQLIPVRLQDSNFIIPF